MQLSVLYQSLFHKTIISLQCVPKKTGFICVCVCVCVCAHTHTQTHIFIDNTFKNVFFCYQVAKLCSKAILGKKYLYKYSNYENIATRIVSFNLLYSLIMKIQNLFQLNQLISWDRTGPFTEDSALLLAVKGLAFLQLLGDCQHPLEINQL